MRKISFHNILLMLLLGCLTFSFQEASAQTQEEEPVFEISEIMPFFKGGDPAMKAYLSSKTEYPEIAKKKKIEGRVIVKFIVEKDGSLTDVHVVKSVDPSLDEEAVRVVRSMPKWTPGKRLNGKPVRVQYLLPVTFKL
ncbi:MAG: energy transducer TonB [Prevotella sp.]|nr:energy transducer TonB [Prevotella sp.]